MLAEARGAMLSRKKAMLVAHLIDALADRLFDEPGGDILQFRDRLRAGSPELGIVFDLVAGRAEIDIETVEVPIAVYGKLSVEDYMVSLYNHHTVQRLRIVGHAGDVHAILSAAAAAAALPVRRDGQDPPRPSITDS